MPPSGVSAVYNALFRLSLCCPKSGPNFHVFGPQILKGRAPKIFFCPDFSNSKTLYILEYITSLLQLHSLADMWQRLVVIGRGTSEAPRLRVEKRKERQQQNIIHPTHLSVSGGTKRKKEMTPAKHNTSDASVGVRRHNKLLHTYISFISGTWPIYTTHTKTHKKRNIGDRTRLTTKSHIIKKGKNVDLYTPLTRCRH